MFYLAHRFDEGRWHKEEGFCGASDAWFYMLGMLRAVYTDWNRVSFCFCGERKSDHSDTINGEWIKNGKITEDDLYPYINSLEGYEKYRKFTDEEVVVRYEALMSYQRNKKNYVASINWRS